MADDHAARRIVKNAHEYIVQFKNKKIEDIIALKVLDKYFTHTVQPKLQ